MKKNILITGASGFIGRALAESLQENYNVLCMSRRDPELSSKWIRGEFYAFEDLRQLDRYEIDAVVHLAAVTGGCLERDGIMVNVEGTRCLMRYLMDRGCEKFVMASSIAAVGMQNTKFRPIKVPIEDEHPCLDRDGYGVSKYLMEELTKYYHRQNEKIDVINLRLSSVAPDNALPPKKKPGPVYEWGLGSITLMPLSEAVRAFTIALEAPKRSGVRIYNTVAQQSLVETPVAEVLRSWWGNDVDLSYFEKAGNEYASVYNPDKINEELGFFCSL